MRQGSEGSPMPDERRGSRANGVVVPMSHFPSNGFENSRGPIGLHPLNEPAESYQELIFVHGMLGDSRNTWTVDPDEKATFWPEWLFDDKAFTNTRIYTYGFEEPLVNGRQIPVSQLWELGVLLCSALENGLKKSSQNPIEFVAHSLGGIVVKAAITHATQSIKFQELGKRFNSVVFLGTPHRDGGDHDMLRNMFRACNTSKVFEPEAEPNTTTVQEINDDFYSCSRDLKLWSFYENVPSPAVSKYRATLRNGMTLPANADHANVVRFRSTSDPTFTKIREILRDLAMEIRDELENPQKIEDHMRIIAKNLGITDPTEGDLIRLERDKINGSCDWLLQEEGFRTWTERVPTPAIQSNSPQVYWLSGEIGCGKSFLAAHIIAHLRKLGHDTSFYFVKQSDVTKQSMGNLLKTIAYQMARRSPTLRRSLQKLQKDDTLLAESNDVASIWSQLFEQRVFRSDPERRHFWIIDALDRARGYEDLLTQLQSLPKQYKVCITSRRDYELDKALRRLDLTFIATQVRKEGTLNDIRMYLERYKEFLPADDPVELQTLMDDLVDKSEGSFLWTSLTVQALSDGWADTDVEGVLSDVPDGMRPLYDQILRKISKSPHRGKAEALLRWVICAARPMSVSELTAAFRLETQSSLKRPAQAIEHICGPLVSVQDGMVNVVHDTVRDYLFSSRGHRSGRDGVEGFEFDKAKSHEHLATYCVEYFRNCFSTRTRNTLSTNVTDEDPFLDYACENFSEHLAESGWADESRDTQRLISALTEFFEGRVLFWIERLAHNSPSISLRTLNSTGKNLKAYVERRNTQDSELHRQLMELKHWANDLIHIVTVFGEDLLKMPEAIHRIIPPLCPTQSRINRDLGHLGAGLEVVGIPHKSWPERISSASFGGDFFATALACCERRYAVALRSKDLNQIVVYRATTCQEIRRIPTNDAVRLLEFAHGRNWLVACGRRTVSLYNHDTGENIWTEESANDILSVLVTRDDSEIITVTREKEVEFRDMYTGKRVDCRRLEHSKILGRSIVDVHISEELGLLALLSWRDEAELYDLRSLQQPRGRVSHFVNIWSMAVNPLKKMLAMSTCDGELFTVGAQSLKKTQVRKAVNASRMAVSMDGKTLVAGTTNGAILIFDFDSLDEIYTLPFDEEEVIALRFTQSSLRFLDIRPHVFNVWEPSALVRRDHDDDSASTAGGSSFTTAVSRGSEATAKSDNTAITAMVEHDSGDFVFCAKRSGAVSFYDTSKGRLKQKLFDFGKTEVLFLAWNKAQNLLASADNSGTIKLHHVAAKMERVPGGKKESWQANMVRQIKPIEQEHPIRQLLVSLDGDLLLVSTTTKDFVFSTKDGSELLSHDCESHLIAGQPGQKWVTCPSSKQRFLEVQKGRCDAIKVTPPDSQHPVLQHVGFADELYPDTVHYGKACLVPVDDQIWVAHDSDPSSAPVVWPQKVTTTSETAREAARGRLLRRFAEVAPQIVSFLGIYKGRLVFVGVDNWISSLRVDEPRLNDPIRYHFPIPHYWRNPNQTLLAFVSVKGEIVIAVEGDLAIVKNALL